MYISKLKIRNYRNFRSATFNFKKGVNTLIGENGSGKTNVFQAIRLLLDEDLSRRSIYLRESDFCRALPQWQGHWIVIGMQFEELDSSDLCQMLKLDTGLMNGQGTGVYTFFFRPNRETRLALHRASCESPEVAIELAESIELEQYEALFTGHGSADFCDDAVYDAIVGSIDKGVFPNPDSDDERVLGTRIKESLFKEVSCTFIKALRDVVGELRNYRDSPLLNLLRGADAEIPEADNHKIRTAIANLNKDIGALKPIRELSTNIQLTLHETAGFAYSPSVDVAANLPDKMDKLLQNLVLRVADPLDEEYAGDLSEISLGGANLIYITLKLLEYELKLSTDRAAHFLLIEEPEAHIHTHVQKTLFSKYEESNTQVIVSTHSTHISAASKIRSVNILAKESRQAAVYDPSFGLDDLDCTRIERYLDAVRSTLLFAKAVLLVEGDAELIMLPTLIRKCLGVAIDELGVSVISMDAAIFENVAKIFHSDRIRRNCAILSDHDVAHIPLPLDPIQDTPQQKNARNSEASGMVREKLLSKLTKDNPYLAAFLGRHTFEIELLRAGNSTLFIETLPDVYVQAKRIRDSTDLVQDSDLGVSGTEVLRLAEAEGKGWFALKLSSHVTSSTQVPDYILRGLAFACARTASTKTIDQMMIHRLEALKASGSDIGTMAPWLVPLVTDVDTLHSRQIEFASRFPTDPLSVFLNELWTYRKNLT